MEAPAHRAAPRRPRRGRGRGTGVPDKVGIATNAMSLSGGSCRAANSNGAAIARGGLLYENREALLFDRTDLFRRLNPQLEQEVPCQSHQGSGPPKGGPMNDRVKAIGYILNYLAVPKECAVSSKARCRAFFLIRV